MTAPDPIAEVEEIVVRARAAQTAIRGDRLSGSL